MKRYRLSRCPQICPQILNPRLYGPSFRLCKHKHGELVFYKDVEERIDQLEDAIDLVIEELSTQDRKSPKERKVGGENLIEFLTRILDNKPKRKKLKKSKKDFYSFEF